MTLHPQNVILKRVLKLVYHHDKKEVYYMDVNNDLVNDIISISEKN